jgi:hypothetical protein
MISVEGGLVIASLIASATMCLVKIITQLENSRCTTIKCCGLECDRSLPDEPVEEVDVPIIPPIPPIPLIPPIPTQIPTIPPTIPRPTLQELRSRFEKG